MRVAPTGWSGAGTRRRLAASSLSLAVCLVAALELQPPLAAQEDPRPAPADAAEEPLPAPVPSLVGRFAWVSADSVDLVADLGGDVPFLVRGPHEGWFDFDLRTTIEDATSHLDFYVKDIQYTGDVGWRLRTGSGGPGTVSLFVGQRGREAVDSPGGGFVRYVAAGLESRRFRQPVLSRPGPDLQWRFALGPVVEDRGVEASAYYRGEARFRYGFGRAERLPRSFAFDLHVDGLARNGDLDADIRFGPGLELPAGGGHRLLLFVHYQYSDNPLGLGEDAWFAGLEFAEGAFSSGSPREGGPDLSGRIAAGAGDDERYSGQVYLRFLSSQFGRRLRAMVDVDANVLTSEDVDDVYWRYDIGLERVRHRSSIGVYLHHRSNHHLAEEGPEFTGRNVVELGCESASWNDSGRRATRRGARFDYRLRLGYIANTDFDDEQWWNIRAGFRWAIPFRALGGVVPYLLWDIEEGEVDARTTAIGVSLNRRLDVQVEWRDDDQLFSTAGSVTLLSARYGF